MSDKTWMIDVTIDEHDRRTRAKASLTIGPSRFVGVGFTRRDPADPEVPVIGDELATARALRDLANQLVATTSKDIENATHEPTRLMR
ncbi:DUF1876 domain-containing protein [Prescottella soli]|uniref:DUF1876 domain-containing protein n=1 Tax=Prescottella soli TaxID=1543852 RepID=A0ABW9FV34_9NOCA